MVVELQLHLQLELELEAEGLAVTLVEDHLMMTTTTMRRLRPLHGPEDAS